MSLEKQPRMLQRGIFRVLFLLPILTIGCGKHGEEVCALFDPIAIVSEVTFKNISNVNYENIEIENRPIELYLGGDFPDRFLRPGREISLPLDWFHLLYDSIHIKLTAAGIELEQIPLDHVGQEPLDNQHNYLFKIDVDLEQKIIITTMEKSELPEYPNNNSCYPL